MGANVYFTIVYIEYFTCVSNKRLPPVKQGKELILRLPEI